MPPTPPSILDRYLDKVIQDNKTIDARGVMQVTRMIDLSMEDVFIHLTVRMNRSDQSTSLLDTINLSHIYSESDPPFTRKPIPRVPEILGQSYFDYGETEKGVSTDNLWQRHSTWVLLGDPGAGKTTLLKHFALQEATACKTGNGYLPIFLPLRLFGKKLDNHFWVSEEAILNYLTEDGLKEMGFADEQERQELRNHFLSALTAGRTLLLLDGLDEQRDHHIQKRTVEAIESLHRFYPGNRFVATSRIVGYDAAPLGAAFNTATLEPFNDEQMSQFFHQWCYAVEKSEDVVADEHTRKRADNKAAQLLEQIHQNPGIRLLATNPLLCTIIGLIQRQGATLPQLRAELYKLFIDTFIFNWEIKKRHREDQTGSLDKDQTQAVLEEIALQLHEHHPENRIPRDKLIDIVSQFLIMQQGMPETEAQHKAVQLLNLIRDVSGLLIDRGNEEYGFFHLTFQEYLAARAITRKKRDIDSYLSRYLFEPRWREVIRLAAAHQGTKDEESGSEFIAAILRQKHPRDDLMHYTFRFAFLCLKEVRVEMATSDRMFRQWIEYFLNEESTRRLFLQLFRQSGIKIRYRPDTLQLLIDILKKKDSDIRCGAAQALGQIGDKTAIAPLILAFRYKDPGFRMIAAHALGRIGDTTAVDFLIFALEDDDSDVRREVAKALGKIGNKAATNLLTLALKDEYSNARRKAAEALGQIGDKAGVAPLILALKDEDSYVRQEVAKALGKIGDKDAVDPLILALKDEDSYVRREAAEALGQIGDKAAVDPLILALTLNHRDFHVNWRAARALGQIGDKAAVDPLILALKDEDSYVRREAAEALGKIDNTTTVDLLIPALKDKNPYVRMNAAESLGKIGNKVAVDPLILALNDEDSYVRGNAAKSLGRIGNKVVVDPLILALKDEDSYVRREAAEALGKIGDKVAVDSLILILHDKDSLVRDRAAEALGKIGNKAAVNPLILTLKDKTRYVREEAARALGEIGDKAAVDPLILALKDEDSYVRWKAIQAIEEIDLKYRLCPD